MTQIGSFRQYFIVFHDDARLSWWLKLFFTRPGFRHCDVYVPYEHGTMCISKTIFNIDVYTWPCKTNDMAEYLSREPGYTVLYLPIVYNKPMPLKLGLFIPSCVALAQKITGFSSHAITPYGFYKALLSSGKAHRLGLAPE